MEKCLPVVKIDIPMIIRALDGLFKLHRFNNGVIHGDCNPGNIMSDKHGELKLVDPVNFDSQQIVYINRTFYKENTPDEEIKVFVTSCFIKAAELLAIPLSELAVRIYTDKYFPVFCKCNEGGFTVTEVFRDLTGTYDDLQRRFSNLYVMQRYPNIHEVVDENGIQYDDAVGYVISNLDCEDDIYESDVEDVDSSDSESTLVQPGERNRSNVPNQERRHLRSSSRNVDRR